jgi:uncharacterized membrane protein HdeD (DUF308 family)
MLNRLAGNPNRLLIRGIVSLAIGVATFVFPDTSLTTVVQLLGAYLMVDGLINFLLYTFRKKAQHSGLILIPKGVGNMLAGVVFLAFPAAMVSIFVFLIGLILIIAGGSQLLAQAGGRSFLGFSWVYTLIAVVATIGGIVLIAKPFESASTILMFFGGIIGLYGLGEIFWSYKLRKYKKAHPEQNQPPTVDVEYEEVKD